MPDEIWEEFMRSVGTEITHADEMHKTVSCQVDLENLTLEEQRRLLSSDVWTLDELLQSHRKTLTAALDQRGLPSPFKKILAKGNKWRELPAALLEHEPGTPFPWRDHIEPGESVSSGFHFLQRTHEPFSDPWFAGRFALLLLTYEHAKPEERPKIAYTLGHLAAVWQNRVYLDSVRRGKKVRKSAADGGKARSKQHLNRRSEILQDMNRLIASGHSISRAASLAFQQGLGTSAEANRQLYRRHKK